VRRRDNDNDDDGNLDDNTTIITREWSLWLDWKKPRIIVVITRHYIYNDSDFSQGTFNNSFPRKNASIQIFYITFWFIQRVCFSSLSKNLKIFKYIALIIYFNLILPRISSYNFKDYIYKKGLILYEKKYVIYEMNTAH